MSNHQNGKPCGLQDLLRALKAEADALQGIHSDLRINIQKLQV